MRFSKKAYFVLGLVALAAIAIVAIGVGVLKFGALPLEDGTQLADGNVTVIADGWGPVTIGAYLFALKDGGFGLIDATMDPEATAIRAALTRVGATSEDVHAVFLTHSHGDHATGARSFPNADVYVLDADVDGVESRGIAVTRGLADGERMEVSGTPVEVFALPGHTPGSSAYLVHGVLFLGDSAAAAQDGSIVSNFLLSDDSEQNERSLRALAERLRVRPADVHSIAFGHQGAVEGLDPLLTWATSSQSK